MYTILLQRRDKSGALFVEGVGEGGLSSLTRKLRDPALPGEPPTPITPGGSASVRRDTEAPQN